MNAALTATVLEQPTPSLSALAVELHAIVQDMLAFEQQHAAALRQVADIHRLSARNLLHYLSLRRKDLRSLQPVLAALGLSSLGRAEAHALFTVASALHAVERLSAETSEADPVASPCDIARGNQLLAAHTEALFGPPPEERSTHIMVTMGTEAASDYSIVHRLLDAGMSCMRINCAHDGPHEWLKMIEHLHQARSVLHRPCTVLMDLGGPKLRSGAIASGPAVKKVKPRRDACGLVIAPGRLWLTARDSRHKAPASADAELHVGARWLHALQPDERVTFRDARGRRRTLRILEHDRNGIWAELRRTAYFTNGTRLKYTSSVSDRRATTTVSGLPQRPGSIELQANDLLVLRKEIEPGRNASFDSAGRLLRAAHVSCSLPQVFEMVAAGERACLDDGRIIGIVEAVSDSEIGIRVQRTPPGGARLMADKGINLPDSALRLPAITERDRADLQFIVQHADMVGLSFANQESDVLDVMEALRGYGGRKPAIVLKIETQRGFRRLPAMLLAAMQHDRMGVMIARGDLAVECGYERLAEAQEEILWICEAAHCPVIWATQVLETLAKQGIPSRAEVTDAAMGNRAECVMLNKGPHIERALQALGDILKRMDAHQDKKSAMLRALRLAIELDLPQTPQRGGAAAVVG